MTVFECWFVSNLSQRTFLLLHLSNLDTMQNILLHRIQSFVDRYDGKNFAVSAILVIVLRVVGGLATGVVFPAMQNLLGRWSPPFERSKLSVTCFSGTTVSYSSIDIYYKVTQSDANYINNASNASKRLFAHYIPIKTIKKL